MNTKEIQKIYPREFLDALTDAVGVIGDEFELDTPENWVIFLFDAVNEAGYCFANKETIARSMR